MFNLKSYVKILERAEKDFYLLFVNNKRLLKVPVVLGKDISEQLIVLLRWV